MFVQLLKKKDCRCTGQPKAKLAETKQKGKKIYIHHLITDCRGLKLVEKHISTRPHTQKQHTNSDTLMHSPQLTQPS